MRRAPLRLGLHRILCILTHHHYFILKKYLKDLKNVKKHWLFYGKHLKCNLVCVSCNGLIVTWYVKHKKIWIIGTIQNEQNHYTTFQMDSCVCRNVGEFTFCEPEGIQRSLTSPAKISLVWRKLRYLHMICIFCMAIREQRGLFCHKPWLQFPALLYPEKWALTRLALSQNERRTAAGSFPYWHSALPTLMKLLHDHIQQSMHR